MGDKKRDQQEALAVFSTVLRPPTKKTHPVSSPVIVGFDIKPISMVSPDKTLTFQFFSEIGAKESVYRPDSVKITVDEFEKALKEFAGKELPKKMYLVTYDAEQALSHFLNWENVFNIKPKSAGTDFDWNSQSAESKFNCIDLLDFFNEELDKIGDWFDLKQVHLDGIGVIDRPIGSIA